MITQSNKSSHWDYFAIASKIASKNWDIRTYHLGAVGIRKDSCIVRSANLPCEYPSPECHAEWRLARKLDVGSTVYVCRNKSGGYGMARPCYDCQIIMKFKGVHRVYYTIDNESFGTLALRNGSWVDIGYQRVLAA